MWRFRFLPSPRRGGDAGESGLLSQAPFPRGRPRRETEGRLPGRPQARWTARPQHRGRLRGRRFTDEGEARRLPAPVAVAFASGSGVLQSHV